MHIKGLHVACILILKNGQAYVCILLHSKKLFIDGSRYAQIKHNIIRGAQIKENIPITVVERMSEETIRQNVYNGKNKGRGPTMYVWRTAY
jgi:hypothetical protein